MSSIVFLVGGAIHSYQAHYFLLKKVSINGGDLVMRTAAKELLGEYINQPLLSLKLEDLSQQLELLPGIANAEIERALNKHELKIVLHKHQPLAQWKAGGMVDVFGQIYFGPHETNLPIFSAPSIRAVEVTEFYDDAINVLSKDSIAQVELSKQGEWRLFLNDGIVLRLGKERPLGKLHVYKENATALKRRFAGLRSIDLRYDKGFSIVYDQQEEQG